MDVLHSIGPQDGRWWRWRTLAAVLILTAAGLRLAYLASPFALDLAPDEAHYWDWSRNLDWSYYSKGPLVAWLIRVSCELTGDWSRNLVGNEMLSVRLPAVLCGSLLLVSLYVLTVQVTRREGLAFAVVAFGLTLPIVAAGSTLMTIDAPYTCCWGWALVFGYHAVFRGAVWAWLAAGLVVGLGILAKYTMVLWVPSLLLFVFSSAEHRGLLRRLGPWLMVAVAGLCCLPILWWNVQNDWVTLRHVSGQAGIIQTTGVRWTGPLMYVVTQFGLLLGFWFVPWAAALVRYRPWLEPDAGLRYLWWMSVPMFGVFLLFSIRTPVEPNWPVTAYLSGGVLAAVWLSRQLDSRVMWYRQLARGCLAVAAMLGVVLTLVLYQSSWTYPLLRAFVTEPNTRLPLPLRRLDPTCRLRGWRELAQAVDHLRACFPSDDPVLVGTAWTIPGELAFYCAGHPSVYSLGRALGDRHSQYDLWRPNPLADAETYRGKTFILIGEPLAALHEAFDSVEPSVLVTHRVADQPVAAWRITVCRGYRGLQVREARY